MPSPLKLTLLVAVCLASFTVLAAKEKDSLSQVAVVADHQPLSFELNKGQAAPEFDYLARGRRYTVLVNRESVTVLLPNKRNSNYSTNAVRIRLLDTRAGGTTRASEPLLTRTNYLLGNDPRHWKTNVPNYGRVAYQEVYPGVDLVYYGRDGELEFDFAVAPGADPRAIHLKLEGAEVSVSHHEREIRKPCSNKGGANEVNPERAGQSSTVDIGNLNFHFLRTRIGDSREDEDR